MQVHEPICFVCDEPITPGQPVTVERFQVPNGEPVADLRHTICVPWVGDGYDYVSDMEEQYEHQETNGPRRQRDRHR